MKPDADTLSIPDARQILEKFVSTDPSCCSGPEGRLLARAISSLQSSRCESTRLLLVEVARKRLSVPVINALALHRSEATIAILIQTLEDESFAPAALAGLELIGLEAKKLLISQSFHRCREISGIETAPSLARRRACLQALARLRLTPNDQRRLRNLLYDRDPALVFAVSRILLSSEIVLFRNSARERLRAVLSTLPEPLSTEGKQLLERPSAILGPSMRKRLK